MKGILYFEHRIANLLLNLQNRIDSWLILRFFKMFFVFFFPWQSSIITDEQVMSNDISDCSWWPWYESEIKNRNFQFIRTNIFNFLSLTNYYSYESFARHLHINKRVLILWINCWYILNNLFDKVFMNWTFLKRNVHYLQRKINKPIWL